MQIILYDGSIYTLLSDTAERFLREDLPEGPPQCGRVSNVVFNTQTQQWDVVDTATQDILYSGPYRAQCIEWEVNYYIHKFTTNPESMHAYV